MKQARVSIVGGGAAGLCAAIASARRGVGVTLLEAETRVGRKILASGNGRCNLSNVAISPSAYNHPDFVEPILTAYPYEVIRTFFNEMGLLTRTDSEGRVYPVTNAAGSVLDALRLECAHLGVDVRCGFEVRNVTLAPDATGFVTASSDGKSVRSDAVVVTTGGGSPLLTNMGHGLVDQSPVLCPVRTQTDHIRGLSGVRVMCAATLFRGVDDDGSSGTAVSTERGELLFRDYGVSGIMIFELSRYLDEPCAISVDLFPDIATCDLETILSWRCHELAWRTAETFFAGMLHDRVSRAVLRALGIAPDVAVADLPASRLVQLLKDFRLPVIGAGDSAQAQVTRGGASVLEFDPATMASRMVDGLFAGGEVLDIDGRSGGFNLHWAWASGIVAGEGAAGSAIECAARRGVDASGCQ